MDQVAAIVGFKQAESSFNLKFRKAFTRPGKKRRLGITEIKPEIHFRLGGRVVFWYPHLVVLIEGDFVALNNVDPVLKLLKMNYTRLLGIVKHSLPVIIFARLPLPRSRRCIDPFPKLLTS